MKRRNFVATAVAALFVLGLSPAGFAAQPANESLKAPTVRVGVLATGTANWELDTIKRYGLDKKHGIDLVVSAHTNKNPAAVALQAGGVDGILTDYIWVSRQRSDGADFTFVPHSLAVGGLIVRDDSGIGSVKDLKGKKIGIAGGPVDKSWLILRAYGQQEAGLDLADVVETKFGSPPLVNQILLKGEVDAVLNFWHFNARLKAQGLKQVVGVTDMLKQLGIADESPLLGWTFSQGWAEKNEEGIKAFLGASRDAKKILMEDDKAWDALRARMKPADDATFTALRDGYREGIVSKYGAKEIAASEKTFAILAKLGGKTLVGDSTTLAPGTFWGGYSF
ncbi:MAG: ABC transporter substrate-binding protein [Proteobacteria bacterium]|nr:ABC transporter substrate-binding protein [Pseudomonadota bacterium]